jgi:hypothetical protein
MEREYSLFASSAQLSPRCAVSATLADGDTAVVEGLVAWISANRMSLPRSKGSEHRVDHFAALSFLQGLIVLKDSGHLASCWCWTKWKRCKGAFGRA